MNTGHSAEVAAGIHRVEAPLGDRIVACYLVIGEGAVLLVDTGIAETPGTHLFPEMERLGIGPGRLRWVVATHCDVDHMGGNAALKAAVPEATLVAGAADVALVNDVERLVRERYSEFAEDHGIDVDDGFKAWCFEIAHAAPVDLAVGMGGARVRLGPNRTVDLIATPGHSRGSLSVWDEATRTALVADAVLGSSVRLADGTPAFPPTYRYVDEYRQTIDLLERLKPELLLTGHDRVMRGREGLDFLAESRAFTDRLEHAVAERLPGIECGGVSTRELVDSVAPVVGVWPRQSWIFLANALVGHLESLEDRGGVRRSRDADGLVRWAAA